MKSFTLIEAKICLNILVYLQRQNIVQAEQSTAVNVPIKVS